MSLRKLKWAAVISFFVAMAFLLLGGLFAADRMAPYPGKVVDQDGLWVARDAGFFESGAVSFLGQIRIVADSVIILLGVVPLFYFLFRTYPRLKAAEIKEGENVWDRLGVGL